MKPWTTAHRTTATSQPQAQSALTGAGSLSASLASRGVVVSRYTWQGTIKPFGQDMGTADDETALMLEPFGTGTATTERDLCLKKP